MKCGVKEESWIWNDLKWRCFIKHRQEKKTLDDANKKTSQIGLAHIEVLYMSLLVTEGTIEGKNGWDRQ